MSEPSIREYHIWLIRVNHHALIATPSRALYITGFTLVERLLRELPPLDEPPIRRRQQQGRPLLETETMVTFEPVPAVQYTVPYQFYGWTGTYEPPLIYQVNVTTKLPDMLTELGRTLRDNLRIST